MDYINTVVNTDCIEFMKNMSDGMVDLTLTDIPYGVVNRNDNGLRSLDKGLADVMQFDLTEFLNEIYRTAKSTMIIFCGKEQLSPIHKFFSEKQARHLGTVRQLVWEKTNPSPMNGRHIYLSGIENAVWFKKRGGCSTLIARIQYSGIHVAEANCTPPKRIMACLKNLYSTILMRVI